MRPKCLLLLTLVPLLSSGMSLSAQAIAADKFSYNGDLGPGFWSEIAPACATTPVSRQSPINLADPIVDAALGRLKLFVPETSYTLSNPGYTVEAKPKERGILLHNGVVYRLKQFHFHTLSEHTIDGQRGPMELHAVFEDDREDYAVIGVLFRIGQPNAFLQQLIDAGIPEKTTSPNTRTTRLKLHEAFPDTASYFTYAGSLTTPKCTENVSWIVLKQWAEMSPEQFEAFRHVLGNDFRPLQDRNGREIRATSR